MPNTEFAVEFARRAITDNAPIRRPRRGIDTEFRMWMYVFLAAGVLLIACTLMWGSWR